VLEEGDDDGENAVASEKREARAFLYENRCAQVMAPVNATDDPLVQIYLRGKSATGKLQRPFKVHNPLADLLGANADDAAAAPAAAPAVESAKTE